MSVFADLRAELVADIGSVDGITVHPYWPDAFNPPVAFVTPPLSEDWARRGPMFGEHTIALDLMVMVEHGAAGAALAALEGFVEQILPQLDAWLLLGVDPPAPTTVSDSGAEYLTAVIRVSKAVRL